jgi:SAM-dependent methyltransferase
MKETKAPITSYYSSRLESFQRSQHEHQGSNYPADVIELVSRIEIESVIEHLDIRPHYTVLDIGAGGGRWTLALAPKVASITAVEPSDLFNVLLSRTKHLPNVTCLHQPFEDVQLSQEFDVAVIYGTLMYVPTDEGARAFLAKAATAVRENGYLVLGEAIARRPKILADWKEMPGDWSVDVLLETSRYWEVLRSATFYREECRTNRLSLVTEFESHAPVFGRTRAWPIVKSLRWHTILAYNKACRNAYGMLKWLVDMRRMRMMVWKKREHRAATSYGSYGEKP